MPRHQHLNVCTCHLNADPFRKPWEHDRSCEVYSPAPKSVSVLEQPIAEINGEMLSMRDAQRIVDEDNHERTQRLAEPVVQPEAHGEIVVGAADDPDRTEQKIRDIFTNTFTRPPEVDVALAEVQTIGQGGITFVPSAIADRDRANHLLAELLTAVRVRALMGWKVGRCKACDRPHREHEVPCPCPHHAAVVYLKTQGIEVPIT